MTKRKPRVGSDRSERFRRLTRKELAGFNDHTKELILEAMKMGCVGHISARGNCILRNNAGGSVSVSRNKTSTERMRHNVRADIRRLITQHHCTDYSVVGQRTTRDRQKIAVGRAFIEHGAAFARWLDQLPEGLPAEQLLQIEFDDTGEPAFFVTQEFEDTDADVPQPEQSSAGHDSDDVPAVTRGGQGVPPATATAAPANTVSDVLVDESELTRLREIVATLHTKLAGETRRADEAHARLELVREVLDT